MPKTLAHATSFKPLLCLPLLGLALASHGATVVDNFTGGFGVGQWAVSVQGGVVDLTGAPLSVLFVSSDDGAGAAEQTMQIVAPSTGFVRFSWAYETQDSSPLWDTFGFVVNGAFIPISDPAHASAQTGNYSQRVNMGDLFGFIAQSYDATGGSASTVISSFRFEEIPAVPEPGSLPLWGLALAAGWVWQRRHGIQPATITTSTTTTKAQA